MNRREHSYTNYLQKGQEPPNTYQEMKKWDKKDSKKEDDMVQWHIHIDAQKPIEDQKFIDILLDYGFFRDDFVEGTGEYAPKEHWTWKGYKKEAKGSEKSFRKAVDAIQKYLADNPGKLDLYMETEHLPINLKFSGGPFDETVGEKIPFKVSKTALKAGEFRDTEVHVTVPSDSDHRLYHKLESLGFFPVDVPETDGSTSRVYTLQGTKEAIREIIPNRLHDENGRLSDNQKLIKYLKRLGGAKYFKVKKENITHVYVLGRPHLSEVATMVEIS